MTAFTRLTLDSTAVRHPVPVGFARPAEHAMVTGQ